MVRSIVCAVALLAAAPAFAQTSGGEAGMPDPNDLSDSFTIAAGAAWLPDYEGSDDYEIVPAGAIRGRFHGHNYFTRATWFYMDAIPRPVDGGIDLDVGPIVGLRMNRTGKIKDDFVDALPERNTAIEVGAFAGVTWHGLTNPYDALSIRVDLLGDVGGAHGSNVITPSIDFGTPLSRTFFISGSLSAEWAGGGYADYYYSISPAASFASGLPVYNADGGLKHWRLGLLANQSITGDLTHGLSVFTTGSYTRLTGDFADSPIVDNRGSPSQWLGALGLAYTF